MTDQENLQELKSQIEKAKEANDGPNGKDPDAPAINPYRVSIELVAGVVVGTLLGIFTDKWLGTSPVFFLIFFILGTLGGFLNIYRLARSQKIDDK